MNLVNGFWQPFWPSHRSRYLQNFFWLNFTINKVLLIEFADDKILFSFYLIIKRESIHSHIWTFAGKCIMQIIMRKDDSFLSGLAISFLCKINTLDILFKLLEKTWEHKSSLLAISDKDIHRANDCCFHLIFDIVTASPKSKNSHERDRPSDDPLLVISPYLFHVSI